MNKCFEIKHRLSLQNEILAYIKSLAKIDNYKVILKSVNKIKKLLKDAEPYNIDQKVIDAAHVEIERLNAERDLRFEIDNIDTSVGKDFIIFSFKRWCGKTLRSLLHSYLKECRWVIFGGC